MAREHRTRLLDALRRRLERAVSRQTDTLRESRHAMKRLHRSERALEREVQALRKGPESRIWRWILQAHADGTAKQVDGLLRVISKASEFPMDRHAIEIHGPVWEDGTRTDGHSGSIWIALLLYRPGIEFSKRTGPSWGDVQNITRASRLGVLPSAVVASLDRAIVRREVCRHMIEELEEKLSGIAERTRSQRRQVGDGRISIEKLRLALRKLQEQQ